MGFYKKHITLCAIVFLTLGICSCATKKITTTKTKTTYVHDTIITFRDRVITKSVRDTLLIESPCDSLGNLKPFSSRIVTGGVKVNIQSKKGKIIATINIDSIVNSRLEIYKSNIKSKTSTVIKEKVVTRYRRGKIFWVSIICNVIFLWLIFRRRRL